jgi:Family of unknown function (DUF5683)
MRQLFLFLLVICLLFSHVAHAQQTYTIPSKPDTTHLIPDTTKLPVMPDSVLNKKDSIYMGKTKTTAEKDSLKKANKHNPQKATLYSTILPGAGQVYNKKYWKVPIVYAAVGIPAYAYFYNKNWYNKCQYALTVCVNLATNGSVPQDSLAKVAPELVPFVKTNDQNGIITNRDSFRKNEDYSVLFFLLFYGLNIVDATVDAQLKDFNVNNDLSFKIKPMFMPGPYMSAGFTVAFNLHKQRFRQIKMN